MSGAGGAVCEIKPGAGISGGGASQNVHNSIFPVKQLLTSKNVITTLISPSYQHALTNIFKPP